MLLMPIKNQGLAGFRPTHNSGLRRLRLHVRMTTSKLRASWY